MTHVEEGIMTTIRDGGLVDGEARHHVDGCAVCRSALDETRARAATVQRLLEALDGDLPIELDAAKAKVRARLDARRDEGVGKHRGMVALLGRAAVLLLLATGAVYALPGSPFRGWLDGTVGEELPAVAPLAGIEAGDGVEVGIPPEGLTVALSGVAADATVEVRWRDGSRATIEGGPGTRYSIAGGRTEATVAAGGVLVGVPRSGGPITIEANGRMIFRRDANGVVLLGDVVSETPESIVFSMGAR